MQVHAESALPSPVENLRWLEDQLDVTYSPVCCSYNAGTTTLLLRLPNAAGGNGGKCSTKDVGTGAPLGLSGWQRNGRDEQNVVDIFGRIQDLHTLQGQRRSGYWGTAEGGLMDLKLPQGQQTYHLPSEPVGSLSQIEESVDSCTEENPTTQERFESTLAQAEFKQSEEAGSIRSFINNWLMLPGSRRLSRGRQKNRSVAGGILKDRTDASFSRGLQFLQWRGRCPKAATPCGSSSIEEGGSRSRGCAENHKMSGGGYRNQQRDARLAKEKSRQAGRFLSLRRNRNETPDSSLANVASPLSVTSPG